MLPKFKKLSPRIGSGTWKSEASSEARCESSSKASPLYKSSGIWKNSELSPLSEVPWDLENIPSNPSILALELGKTAKEAWRQDSKDKKT